MLNSGNEETKSFSSSRLGLGKDVVTSKNDRECGGLYLGISLVPCVDPKEARADSHLCSARKELP